MLLCGLAACQELPEVRYETDHLKIAPDFDHPICAGTLDSLETHVRVVEATVGPEPPDDTPIELYWLSEGVGDWCSRSESGCFYPGTRMVFAAGPSVRHELVHAVINATDGNAFVEEGIAEMLSGVGVYHRPRFFGEITAGLRTSRAAYRDGDLDYTAAAHVLRFVHDELGPMAARRLAEEVRDDATVSQLQDEVASLFGVPFRDVEHRYLEEAETYYAGLGNGVLQRRTLAQLRDGFTIELRCDEVETSGPLPGEVPGMYRVLRLFSPSLQVGNLKVEGPPGTWVDLIDPFAAGWRQRQWDWRAPLAEPGLESVRVDAGSDRPVALQRGTKLLMVGSDGFDPVRVDVSLVLAR